MPRLNKIQRDPGVTDAEQFFQNGGLEQMRASKGRLVTLDGVSESLQIKTEGITAGIITVTEDYTPSETDHTILVDATTATVTITLPSAVGITGKLYGIKKLDNVNDVTIDGDGSEEIDGAVDQTISTQYGYISVQSDGTGWHIVG